MKFKKFGLIIVVILILWAFSFVIQAQNATVESFDDPDPAYRVQAWLATYTDEDGAALLDPDTGEEVTTYAAFLEYDDGLIAVLPGADIIYTLAEEGYTGHFLVADPDISVSSSLEIVDEDTRLEVRSTDMFGIEQLSYISYMRTDEEVEIWSESTRDFIETTMLGTCLGKTTVNLSFGWAAPDILMPIYFADDGTVLMDYRIYTGGENEDISTRTVGETTTTTVVTRSIEVAPSSIAFRLHGIIDGRDDCEMIYESTFTPFDEVYDNLFERSQEIANEFERE